MYRRNAARPLSRKDPPQGFPISKFLEHGRPKPDDRRLFQDFVKGYHAAYPVRGSARWVAGDPDEEGNDNNWTISSNLLLSQLPGRSLLAGRVQLRRRGRQRCPVRPGKIGQGNTFLFGEATDPA